MNDKKIKCVQIIFDDGTIDTMIPNDKIDFEDNPKEFQDIKEKIPDKKVKQRCVMPCDTCDFHMFRYSECSQDVWCNNVCKKTAHTSRHWNSGTPEITYDSCRDTNIDGMCPEHSKRIS